MTDNVIQGEATLDITPFLASLATLEAQVNATVATAGLAIQRFAASASQSLAGVAGFAVPIAGGATQLGKEARKATDAAADGARKAQQAYQGWGATLTQHQQQLKKIEDNWNSIYRAGAQISQTSTTMTLMGAGILAVEGASIKAASGLDFWIAKYKSAATAAGDFLVNEKNGAQAANQIEEIYRNVAVDTGENAASIAESAYRWQSAAGTQIRSIGELRAQTAGLTAMIKASVIAGIDQSTVIRGVAQILGAYNMNAGEATRVTEVLSNAAQISNAEFGDFVESAKMGAAAAHLAGIPFEEFVATLAKLSNVGQRGTQAGRGMQMMMQGLVDPSNEANEALQSVLATGENVGKSWRELIYPGGEFVGLLDRETASGQKQLGLIGQLYQATQKMTQVDREQFLAKITTQNAYRILAPLIQAYGEDLKNARIEAETGAKSQTLSLSQLNTILSDSVIRSKSFDDQWQIVSKTINRMWSSELQRLDAAIGQVGTTASGALLPFVHTLGDVALGIRTWMLENPQIASALVSVGTAAAVLLAVLGPLGFLLGQTVQGFVAVGNVLKAGAVPILAILGGSIGTIVSRLSILGAATVLLVNAWRNNWLGLTPVLNAVGSSIRDTLGVVILTIGRLVEIVVSLFQGDWQKAWDLFLDVVVTILALFKLNLERQVVAMYNWGVNLVGQLAKGLLDGAGAVLRGVLEGIGEMIAGFFRGASPPKVGPLSTIDKWGMGVMRAYGDGLTKGADQYIKPAATETARMMALAFETTSISSGRLSKAVQWGTDLMDSLLRGLQKADFSMLNDAAQMVSTYLRNALENKKISPATFLGDMSSIKSDLANVLDTIRKGGDLAASAFDRVKKIVGSLGDDLQKVFSAYGEVERRQQVVDSLTAQKDALEQQKYEQYDKPRQALEDQSKDLDILKLKYLDQKQVFEDLIETENRLKEPIQDEIAAVEETIQGYQDKIDAINEAKHAIEDEKRALEEQKVPIQEAIDAIQAEIQAHRDAQDALNEKLSDLRDVRGELEDQVNLIEHRYDVEEEGARGAIALLRDQLVLLKQQNDERLKPFEIASNAASSALSDKQLADRREEEALQRRITDFRNRGASSYYIDKLQTQLDQLKSQHQVEQDQLEDQKSAADRALDAAREAAQIAEDSLQKQLDEKDRAERELERVHQATIAQEAAALKARIDAIDKASATLEKQSKAIDKEIAADEKRSKIEEAKIKGFDKQIAALDKEERARDKEADNIQHSITAEQHKEKNLQKQIDAYDKQVLAYQRQERTVDDEIKAIENRQKVLDYQAKVLEQENRPLIEAVDAINRQIDAADKMLKDAQDRLAIEQAIADLHEQDRKDAEAAAQSGKGAGGVGAGAGEEDQGLGIGKGLDAMLEEWRNKLLKQFKLLSPELEEEKKKIRQQFKEMFDLSWIPEEVKKKLRETGVGIDGWLQETLGRWNKFWGEDFLVILHNSPENIRTAVDGLLTTASMRIDEWSSGAKKSWGEFWGTTLPKELANAQANLNQSTEETLKPLKTTADNIFSSIRDTIVGSEGDSGIVGTIRTSIENIMGRDDRTGLRKAWKSAHDGFDAASNTAFTTIKDFLIGDKGVITSIDNTIRSVLGEDDTKGLRSVFKNAFDAFVNALNVLDQPVKTVQGWLKSLQTTAENALNAIKNAAGGSGSDNWNNRQAWDGTDYAEMRRRGVPGYAEGGIVSGPVGAPQLAIVHGGEPFLGVGKSLTDFVNNLSLGVAQTVINSMPPVTPEIHQHFHVGMVISESGDFKWLASKMRQQNAVRASGIAN